MLQKNLDEFFAIKNQSFNESVPDSEVFEPFFSLEKCNKLRMLCVLLFFHDLDFL